MSDSPIESTKGLHESKERKPERPVSEKGLRVLGFLEDAARGYTRAAGPSTLDRLKTARREAQEYLASLESPISPLRLGYAPHSPDGSETRREIIGAALWDAREHYPHFNVADLGDYIEGKLQLWESKPVALPRGAEPETPTDWLENAERDYAFGGYEFFGQEWGEKLIAEVRQLRVRLEESRAMRNALIRKAANAD